MESPSYHKVFEEESFRVIGLLDYHWPMRLRWNSRFRIELATVEINTCVLLRATKHYRLRAMGQDGEMYTRDLSALQEFLVVHFPESHFWLSTFRDITPSLATSRIEQKNYRHLDREDDVDQQDALDQTSSEILELQSALERDGSLLRLNRNRSSLIQRHLPAQIAQRRRRLQQLIEQRKGLDRRLTVQEHLEKEYQRKAEAVALCFTHASNIQIARDATELADAIHSVVKEVQDAHKYQIRQKLEGGKLKIYTEELAQPGIALLSRWVGAVLNPRQLARLGPEFAELSRAVEEELMVLPQQDILLGGSVQDEKKLVGARVVRNFLKKLEVVPTAPTGAARSPASAMPVWIGNVYQGNRMTAEPWQLPLENTGHMYLSGRTGSGKSFLARVIVEGCLSHTDVSVLILDPGNQWLSILLPEDRLEVLDCYERFGFEPASARGFSFAYYAPGLHAGDDLPSDLGDLAMNRHLVSFRGMSEQDRCNLAADILQAVFRRTSRCEAGRRRTIIVVEEVPNFIRKRAAADARGPAGRSQAEIDRISREGRKYGLTLLLISQSIRDFSHDVAIVRQNITTRIFMANSDREVEYAADSLDDGTAIVQLKPGQAFVCNPAWDTALLEVRPPLSKVWQPDDASVQQLVGSTAPAQAALSPDAQAVWELVCERHGSTGQPVRLAEIAEHLGLTSRRRLQAIVEELERAEVAKFSRLRQRGQPLVVVPTRTETVHKPCENADGNGQ